MNVYFINWLYLCALPFFLLVFFGQPGRSMAPGPSVAAHATLGSRPGRGGAGSRGGTWTTQGGARRGRRQPPCSATRSRASVRKLSFSKNFLRLYFYVMVSYCCLMGMPCEEDQSPVSKRIKYNKWNETRFVLRDAKR